MRGLVRQTGMPLPPNACVCCGSNPQKEDGSGPEDSIFAEGVDIDWGNSVYICKSCVAIMAKLFDFVTPKQVKAAKKAQKGAEAARDAAVARAEAAEERARRMVEGKKAVKEQKEVLANAG